MAKRILVPVERTNEMEFALRVARMIARESGGMVRLLTVLPIPTPLRDWRDCVVVTADQRMERLASSAAAELRRLAAVHLDGTPVETSVVFGDRAVEIGVEAECFGADLVVMPPRRRGPAARLMELARRLFAGRPVAELAVPRLWRCAPSRWSEAAAQPRIESTIARGSVD